MPLFAPRYNVRPVCSSIQIFPLVLTCVDEIATSLILCDLTRVIRLNVKESCSLLDSNREFARNWCNDSIIERICLNFDGLECFFFVCERKAISKIPIDRHLIER